MQKFTRRQAFEDKNYVKYQWATPKHANGCQERRHPNDIPTPMDMDPPVFTRVRCAYTEEDKNCFRKEGRCFNCDQRGHMACECPKKKQQFGQSSQTDQYRSQYNRSCAKPIPQKKPFGSKPMGQGFRKKNQFNYKPQIRTAYIKDAEEQGNEDE
ncbi:MAG TPA: hypothetical protein VEP90_08325 [Methylomirabilota bacterium]|nr:hypothetical protein [Methylomirabilota bacterium]